MTFIPSLKNKSSREKFKIPKSFLEKSFYKTQKKLNAFVVSGEPPAYLLFLTCWPLLDGCQDLSRSDDRSTRIPSKFFSGLGKTSDSPESLQRSNHFDKIQQEAG